MSAPWRRSRRGCTSRETPDQIVQPSKISVLVRRRMSLTLSNFLCQCTSDSLPAASIHVSTALARSGLIARILSSALGDFRSNCSIASNRIAAGCVEPGAKTAKVGSADHLISKILHTSSGTSSPETFWTKSQLVEEMILRPSGSPTSATEGEYSYLHPVIS